jgi:lipopolysaccharide/colanic/teichoic acid biosynthesis glycosyltransferase
MISKLQLVNLPQLINIVRGEMALFGPRPVREKFARRLTECMPFYSYRFSVKPGVLGWAQVHVQDRISPPEESTQIEYDLHYIKAGAPILDLEILIRTLLGALGTRRRNRRANQSSQATRH